MFLDILCVWLILKWILLPNYEKHGSKPEKVSGPNLVKKFLAFYGTRRLITAFTRNPHQI
jgi:hypothetical protein